MAKAASIVCLIALAGDHVRDVAGLLNDHDLLPQLVGSIRDCPRPAPRSPAAPAAPSVSSRHERWPMCGGAARRTPRPADVSGRATQTLGLQPTLLAVAVGLQPALRFLRIARCWSVSCVYVRRGMSPSLRSGDGRGACSLEPNPHSALGMRCNAASRSRAHRRRRAYAACDALSSALPHPTAPTRTPRDRISPVPQPGGLAATPATHAAVFPRRIDRTRAVRAGCHRSSALSASTSTLSRAASACSTPSAGCTDGATVMIWAARTRAIPAMSRSRSRIPSLSCGAGRASE